MIYQLSCAILLLLMIPATGFSAIASSPTPANIKQLWENFEASNETKFSPGKFPYQTCFENAARQNNVPVALLLAVGRGESNFNAKAESKANAHGIMQIQWPGTAKDLGFSSIKELQNPCKNISAGSKYLRQLIDRYKGSYHLALAAYNYGLGRIKIDRKPPEGAQWYSGYIYDKLNLILSLGTEGTQINYNNLKQRVLLTFSRPFQATSYINFLRKEFPMLNFDWFRDEVKYQGYYAVLVYDSEKTLRKAEKLLQEAGYLRK